MISLSILFNFKYEGTVAQNPKGKKEKSRNMNIYHNTKYVQSEQNLHRQKQEREPHLWENWTNMFKSFKL